jgi:hypothetical protein
LKRQDKEKAAQSNPGGRVAERTFSKRTINDVWRQCNQLVSASPHAFGHLARETIVKSNVTPFIPAQFVKTLL